MPCNYDGLPDAAGWQRAEDAYLSKKEQAMIDWLFGDTSGEDDDTPEQYIE
jgi:hypothetical protein